MVIRRKKITKRVFFLLGEINLHLPQGNHVVSELKNLLSVHEQIVTGQSGSPVVRLVKSAFLLMCS